MSEPHAADLPGTGQGLSVSSYSASGSGEGVVDEVRLWLEDVAGDLILIFLPLHFYTPLKPKAVHNSQAEK